MAEASGTTRASDIRVFAAIVTDASFSHTEFIKAMKYSRFPALFCAIYGEENHISCPPVSESVDLAPIMKLPSVSQSSFSNVDEFSGSFFKNDDSDEESSDSIVTPSEFSDLRIPCEAGIRILILADVSKDVISFFVI